jgi:putative protease
LEVHISTQQNISNFEAVKFFAQYATVMVLARELELHQIKNIIDRIKEENIIGPDGKLVRIELFAHGAMCMAISGKCYLSLTKYNRSANRGACVQQCRREYKVIDEQTGDELILDNGLILSPKDMCIIEFFNEILGAGVSVLKIEGRGRTPEYVYTTTKVYKEAVQEWQRGSYSKEMFPKWLEELQTVFNRGFWRGGYYLGEEFGEWTETDGNMSSKRKIYLGIVSNYFARLKVGEFKVMAGEVTLGQEILVTGETTGAVYFKVEELRVDGKPVEKAVKGDVVSLPVPIKVRRRNKVYLILPRTFGDGNLGGEVINVEDDEDCSGCSCH